MVGTGMGHGPRRAATNRLARAVRSVIDSLESRRLLSAEGIDEALPVDETLPEEAVYFTLAAVSEDEDAADGEVKAEVVEEAIDGEAYPEEWVYFTLAGEGGEEGEVVNEEWNESYPEEWVYMNGPNGEATTTSENDVVDTDGDGEPDNIIPISLQPAKAVLKKNGTLTVTGTEQADDVQVTLGKSGDKVIVTVNGTKLGTFDVEDVKKIKVSGRGGDDTIALGDGIDIDAKLRGQAGDDTVTGAAGDDKLTGGEGDDVLDGKGGDDRVRGGKGNDDVSGGNGTNDLAGGRGNDTLRGGRNTDGIRGGRGKDRIMAGAGDDFIDGGNGADRLMGDAGVDGVQDPNSDVLVDGDEEDMQFSTTRLAAPGWWNPDGEGGDRCLPEFPDCVDTVGDEMMPPWWQPGDSDGNDTPEEFGQRVDPSYYPDGNYPDDTPGSDEELV